MVTNRLINMLFFLGIVVPALIVFKTFFSDSPLVWGDAPYFYNERLKEFVAEPQIWTSWGENLGGVSQVLWLYPLMFLYGGLHLFFGFNNDLIIRILFYFPAVIFAFITPMLFTRHFRLSKTIQFFTSLFYGLNTYFLLLIDGGQVGIALAYGFFPLVLLFLYKFIDKPTRISFYSSLIFLFLEVVFDPRFVGIAIIGVLFWSFANWLADRKALWNLKYLIPLGIAVAGLSSYWLIPTLKLGIEDKNFDIAGFGFLSLLNSLFIFQPHWPINEFGKVSPPPFYFVGIPLLVFGSLFFARKEKKIPIFTFCFLIFAFLAKGPGEPFGVIYKWIVGNLPFGVAFRDSTKFFTPLLLFGGILLGITTERLYFLGKRFGFIFLVGVYSYLLFLISPVLTGQLRGVLATREFSPDFEKVYEKLKSESDFLRTLWFPERHPFTFQTEEKPALDAKSLVEERPFASLNVGILDRFNFMHQEEFLDWFKLLGIKYLIFSGEHRKMQLNEEEQEDWNKFLELAVGISGLEKLEWATSFPIYRVPDIKPRIFTVDKLIAVIGSDDIYQKLKQVSSEFSITNQPFVFLEDGKLNPRSLEGLSADSVFLIFNDKEETALAMSFLQKYFKSIEEITDKKLTRWGTKGTKDYLKWKYELLINGIKTKEFNYNKGIVFSTQEGETFYLEPKIPTTGEYVFAMRYMSSAENSLRLNIFYEKDIDNSTTNGKFEWYIEGPFKLEAGNKRISIKNKRGAQVINIAALIPKEDWERAQRLVKNFTGHFETVKIEGMNGIAELDDLLREIKQQEIEYEMISPTRYKLNPPGKKWWLIFSERYHPAWQLKRDRITFSSLPFYSVINGFYIEYDWDKAELIFAGQKEARWGIYWSTVSLFLLIILFFWLYSKK